MSEKIVLIDGHSILNRAYFGIPDLTNSEGTHTNAIYGFLNILFKTLDEEQPSYLEVAFDLSAPTFRHKKYADYKGNRKPMQPELREQVPILKELLRDMQIPVVTKEGYEADDILGTLSVQAQEKGLDVRILSGDRDLLQLATDKVHLILPKTKKTGTELFFYDADAVKEQYQVTPKEFIDVKALMGDSSDNIPGVPGIGEKGATKLIAQYHSVENVYAHLEEVVPNRTKNALEGQEQVALDSKYLVTIDVHSPVDLDLEEAKIGNFYTPEAYLLMKKLDFKNFLPRFSDSAREDPLEGKMEQVSSEKGVDAFLAGVTGEDTVSIFLPEEEDGGGFSFCKGKDHLYYLPGSFNGLLGKFLPQVLEKARRLVCLDLKALFHAAKVEGTFSEEERRKMFDLGLVAYLLNPLKGHYAYDEVASDYAGVMLPAKEDLLPKKSQKKKLEYGELEKKQMEYACAGAIGTFASFDKAYAQVKEQGMESLYLDIELPLVYTLYAMEREGIRADRDALASYGEKLGEAITVAEKEIYDLAGEEFNILSPKQLGVVLFEHLKLPGGKKTKTGYSTAADVLEKLAGDYPIVDKVLQYRQLTKLKSTYADSLQDVIREDGRIHTTFNQTVTATGRLSSTDPNLQNIPIRMDLGRQIRKVFAPRDGWIFLDGDYSQIELRVLAHMSGDENLIEAFRESKDIHRTTASQVFHVPFDEVTPLQRRNAKAVNFGIIYGISAFGLSQDLSISRKEAQDFIDRYFATYPKVKGFLDGLVSSAKENGFCSTLFGRIRPMPELSSSNFMQRSFGERVAMNAPIQGTAADIIKIAMNRVYERMKKEGLRSRLLLQVHDELLIEAPPEEEAYVRELMLFEMTHAADLKVKLEVDINEGKNWYEAK